MSEVDPALVAAIDAISSGAELPDDPSANIGVTPSDPATRDESPTPASTEEGAGDGAAANQPSPASTPEPDVDAAIHTALTSPDSDDQGEAVPDAPESAADPATVEQEPSDELSSILEEHLGHKPTVDEIVGLLTAFEQQQQQTYSQPLVQPTSQVPPTPAPAAPAPQKFQPVPVPEYAEPEVRQALEAQNRNIEAMNAQLEQANMQRQQFEAEQQRLAQAENDRYIASVSQGYREAQKTFYDANPDLTTAQKVRLEKSMQEDGRVWAFVQSEATPAEGIKKFYEFLAYTDENIRSSIDAARAARAAAAAEESAKRKAKASATAGGGGAIPRDNTVLPTTRAGRDAAALKILEEAMNAPHPTD